MMGKPITKQRTIKYEVQTNSNGCSLWRNKTWFLDASSVLDDGTVSIHLKHMKIVSQDQDSIELVLKDWEE